MTATAERPTTTGQDDSAGQGLFAQVHTPGARLIRCATPPDLSDLTEGDMVICADGWGITEYSQEAADRGVHVRCGRYRMEDERVLSRRGTQYVAPDYPEVLGLDRVAPPARLRGQDIVACSTDSFAAAWDALSVPVATTTPYTPADGLVPADWVEYLPFPTLNPAQVQALPHVTGQGSTMVVAPTGAGKTVIGMLAALKEIKERGGKAAWLVPQRSLTTELDRELQVWRDLGIKVVALSGEAATDQRRTRQADVWVATTEKFEALCRSTSMRQAVADIGTLVVDEIHLLGEPSRGPMLETLLARIRSKSPHVRLVGLSATASNADQVAGWLGADLVEITWRPTRLTQQMLTIPALDSDSQREHRNTLCAKITGEVSMDGGSTLVFCGSKANVRSTALAIAASRGAPVTGVDPSDVDAVAHACDQAKVGLHYSDWPHRKAAEEAFRDRTIDVLVATSTLAAGVNTPARVVIVRDTSIGPTPMEVSMVQQMFGRAGRAGKEPEGWSLVLCAEDELATWRKRLADGYTIRSGLLDNVADHLLGEVVQGGVRTTTQMEAWWRSTLAHHQGTVGNAVITQARDFLTTWKFITVTEDGQGGQDIAPTPLGSVTSKMMVPVRDAATLLSGVRRAPAPTHHAAAEVTLTGIVAAGATPLATAPDAPQDQCIPVLRVLQAGGDVNRVDPTPAPPPKRRVKVPGHDVSQAGLLLCARSPQAIARRGRQVAGINRSLIAPALYDSPRYFAWLAALGPMGLAPGWVSVVAADLGARVRHHRLAPPRGAGRLLRLCEAITDPNDSRAVAALWGQVKGRGASTPSDWPFPTPPAGCPLGTTDYQALLDARVRLHQSGNQVHASPGAQVYAPGRDGAPWRRVPTRGGKATATGPVAAFGASNDWAGTGWLEAFTRMH